MTPLRSILTVPRHAPWVAASALVMALGLAGCSEPAEEELDAIAVGENGSVGSVKLLSVLLVSENEGEPGRLLGTLDNETDEPLEVTLSDEDDSVTVTVGADDQYPFNSNEALFSTAGDAPGANTTITVEADGETTELTIPVLDGTLERYRPYLPE